MRPYDLVLEVCGELFYRGEIEQECCREPLPRAALQAVAHLERYERVYSDIEKPVPDIEPLAGVEARTRREIWSHTCSYIGARLSASGSARYDALNRAARRRHGLCGIDLLKERGCVRAP